MPSEDKKDSNLAFSLISAGDCSLFSTRYYCITLLWVLLTYLRGLFEPAHLSTASQATLSALGLPKVLRSLRSFMEIAHTRFILFSFDNSSSCHAEMTFIIIV